MVLTSLNPAEPAEQNGQNKMNTQNKKQAENTIVAFHVGRGGRFHNAGHVTFVGKKGISEFTNNLFIKERENGKFCTPEWVDACGNSVGLTVKQANSGIGSIDIDGAYDTTNCMYLSECSDDSIINIIESNDWDRNDLLDMYAEWCGFSHLEIQLMRYFNDYKNAIIDCAPNTKNGVRCGYIYLDEEFTTYENAEDLEADFITIDGITYTKN